MKFWKWLILGAALAATLVLTWIVWQRPQPVEMATYVPAETLLYLEANDLPQVLQSLTKTEAWQQLAPIYGVEKDFATSGWLNRILADANLGSTKTVVFGRAQIAVALMSVGAADAAGESLKIRPQFAVVIETKSSFASDFVETEVGDFARRQFGAVRIEKKEADGAAWTIFRSVSDERNLFAAVQGTMAIVGNDEPAVQACLDAKSGKRKSLADNENLAKMRVYTERETAFAFGFVTTEGIKQLSSIGAVMLAGQMAEDPRAMSLLAQSLPAFVQKSVTAIGWTARERDGQIEDLYFVQMPPDLVSRLREPLTTTEINPKIAELLPSEVQSITFYNLKNPQVAWRGVIFAMTTRLDALSAAAFSQASGGLLVPYGVERADDFLGAATNEIVTARLSADNEAIGIVGVKNNDALKKALQSSGEKKSDLFDNYLLLGEEKNLQFCRQARERNQTFQTQPIWLKFKEAKLLAGQAFVQTLTRDDASPISFVKLFAKDKAESNTATPPFSGDKLPDWSWTISETGLVREGVARRTISPFGLMGTLATSLTEK